jgi:hypothetical protein
MLLYQLWPLIAIAGIFGIIIARNACIYYWDESARIVADNAWEIKRQTQDHNER